MPPSKRTPAKKTTTPRAARGGGDRSGAARSPSTFGSPELIVMADPAAALRMGAGGVTSRGGADTRALDRVAARPTVTLRPLFGPEDRVRLQAERLLPNALAPGARPVGLLPRRRARRGARRPRRRARRRRGGAGRLRQAGQRAPGDQRHGPGPGGRPAHDAGLPADQGYLDAAPGGVDARYAWTWPGGGGAGVRIIDCEWGWHFDHEDLTGNQGGIVVGTGSTDRNHGTAVLGEIGGDRNAFGITGICPDAVISAAAFSGPTAATSGRGRPARRRRHHPAGDPPARAAAQLRRGGRTSWATSPSSGGRTTSTPSATRSPGASSSSRPPATAPRTSTTRSTTPAGGLPRLVDQPFQRRNRDSGAVVVGAGAPPPGTHGLHRGADRSRLDFSNWGALIDAQGWGREVTSTGYGDLQGGATSGSGTRTASPAPPAPRPSSWAPSAPSRGRCGRPGSR